MGSDFLANRPAPQRRGRFKCFCPEFGSPQANRAGILRDVRAFLIFIAFLLLGAGAFVLGAGGIDKMREAFAGPTLSSKSGTPEPGSSPTPAAEFDKNAFASINPRCADSRIPVLMFHDIVKERGRHTVWFDCTIDELKEQLDFFKEEGANFLTLEQLHEHLTRGKAVPPKSVVLTFDDNYQGFYDLAYPLLKERQIPSAVFVHTNFVGDKSGDHPKMDWGTLKALDSEGLVTIGSHTLSHPAEFEKLDPEKQRQELTESKSTLEAELNHPVPYFAYPEGRGDEVTFQIAKDAGYTMCFTVAQGPSEQSPGILQVNRYVHTKYKDAWKQAQDALRFAPAAIVETPLANNPVMLVAGTYDGIRLAMTRGGKPFSVRANATGRMSVGEFCRDNNAVAGMNGTFFVNADLRSADNAMIGPCRTHDESGVHPDIDPIRLPRIQNRPLVVWNEKTLVILPFSPSMNDDLSLDSLLPGLTDCFMAGAWIVHDGEARTKEEIAPFAARDFNDPRKRAFFGITGSGDVVLGASRDVITTTALARAAAAAGVKEAVLMDSGFSTSIVFDGKIMATGHSAKNLPSRPVPHGILVTGTLEKPTEEEAKKLYASAETALGKGSALDAQMNAPRPGDGGGRRRRRR